MALPAVGVFLLALTSFSAATAPDCKDLVKPFIPEDPKVVSGVYVPFAVCYLKKKKKNTFRYPFLDVLFIFVRRFLENGCM